MSTNCSVQRGLVHGFADGCPEECQYLVPSSAYTCLFACVEGRGCSKFNMGTPFADPVTKRCERCDVRFCKVCGGSGHCKECHQRFVLSEDGQVCSFDLSRRLNLDQALTVVGGLLGALILFGIYWTCTRRTHINTAALNLCAIRQGRRHRHFCKVQDWNSVGASVRSRYGLFENLHRKFVLGVGLGLFYNSFIFLALTSALTLIGTASVYHTSDISDALVGFADMGSWGQERDMSRCSRAMELREETSDFASKTFVMLSCLFPSLFVLSLLYGWLQKRFATKFDAENSTMRDYALEVKGFPSDTPPDEPQLLRELEDRFRELVPDVELVGVSICYDYFDRADEVSDLLWRFMQRADSAEEPGHPSDEVLCDRRLVRAWFSGEDGREPLGIGHSVFCVFRYKKQMRAVLEALKANPGSLLWRDAEDGRLKHTHPYCEPPSVCWWHVGMSDTEFNLRLFRAVLKVVGAIVAFGTLVMWPYAEFVIKPSSGAGSTPSGTLFAVAGILLGNMNMFLCINIWLSAFTLGFLRKDRMDRMIFLANAFLSLLNTCFNLLMASYFFVFDSTVMWSELFAGSSLAAVALENEIARNIYNMCVPGSMFVGYLLMPLMAGIMPFIWNTFLMHAIFVGGFLPECLLKILKAFLPWAPSSCSEYPLRNAEKGLEPMEVGLPWDYASNIVNPSIAFAMLFCMSPNTWRIFLALLCWSLFVYCFSRWVHLRFNKLAFYTTHRLDVTVNYAWGVPLSIVAAAWAHWGVRSGMLGASHWHVPIVFCGSLALWIFSYSLLRPTSLPEVEDLVDRTYEETQSDTMYSWFNTNPIFVLKSFYFPHLVEDHPRPLSADGRRTVFYEVGKEYLLLDTEQRHRASAAKLQNDPLEFETYLDPLMDFIERLCYPSLSKLADKLADSAALAAESAARAPWKDDDAKALTKKAALLGEGPPVYDDDLSTDPRRGGKGIVSFFDMCRCRCKGRRPLSQVELIPIE